MRLNVLSCGAGVQSTTLALLACNGDLPGLDAAIFADAGWEPAQPCAEPQCGHASEHHGDPNGPGMYRGCTGNAPDVCGCHEYITEET